VSDQYIIVGDGPYRIMELCPPPNPCGTYHKTIATCESKWDAQRIIRALATPDTDRGKG
jgi:hypothetical protein